MQKSITAVLAFFLCAAALVHAQGDIQLKENAPDSYVVQKGDTLWSIAVKFLKDPWRWPEIWRLNQEQIRNPHDIVPGSTIVLDRTGTAPGGDGQPQLRLSEGQPQAQPQPQQRLQLGRGGGSERLSPKAYATPLDGEAIPAIPAHMIEPFLTEPLVIENAGLARAPRIVATQESRVYLGRGGVAYVTGFPKTQEEVWQVYRQGRPLVDPEDQRTLGYEAVYLGTVRVTRPGDPATVEIISSKQEIATGDRLIAAGRPAPVKYAPHSPTKPLRGRVIGLYNGLATAEGGANSIISINKGARDGLEHGHVLALYRRGALLADPESGRSRDNSPMFQLPDERYGLAFVFRIFDNVSYALVMESSRPLSPGDVVQTP